MGKSLQELGLSNETLEGTDVGFDQMPEFGAFTPPPQPGGYRFRLPVKLGTAWDTVATDKYGQRVRLQLDQDAPLTIVQSPKGDLNGEPFQTNLSNVPRPRGKDKLLVSDLDLLLRALALAHPEIAVTIKRPTNNPEYIKAVQAYAGKEFGADVEWSWYCNPKRPIYIPDGQGGSVEHPDKQPGCGARYYQKDVDKIEGEYPLRITCTTATCGAVVRAFANLGTFRK
jgi:hypothetical protein